MGKIIHLFLLFFLVINGMLYSSSIDYKIDSTRTEIGKCKIDSNKVNLLFYLGRLYDFNKSSERISCHIDALELAYKIDYHEGVIKVSPTLISNLYYRTNDDIAMSYCIKYLQFLEKNNYQEEVFKTYKLYGNLLCRQKKHKVAKYYYDKAYQYYKSKKDYYQCASVFNNLSILYLDLGNYDSALVYNSLSGQMFQVNKNLSESANSKLGYAEIMMKKGDLEAAFLKANESLKMYQEINIENGIVNALFVLGDLYSLKKQYGLSLDYYKQTLELANKLNLSKLKRDTYIGMANSYAGLHRYEEAYNSQLLYKVLNDSIAEQTIQDKMISMEVKYDISKKESQLKENEYQLEVQSKQRNQLLLLVLGSFILLVIFFFAYRQKRKTNQIIYEQKRIVDEKQKEIIDSINYAKRIQQSILPTSKYIASSLKRLNRDNFK